MKFVYALAMLLSFSAIAQQGSVVAGGRGPQIDWSNLPQKVIELEQEIADLRTQNTTLQNQVGWVNSQINALNIDVAAKLAAFDAKLNGIDSRVGALEPKYVWQCTVSVVKSTGWGTSTTTYTATDKDNSKAQFLAKKNCLDVRNTTNTSVYECNSPVPACIQIKQ